MLRHHVTVHLTISKTLLTSVIKQAYRLFLTGFRHTSRVTLTALHALTAPAVTSMQTRERASIRSGEHLCSITAVLRLRASLPQAQISGSTNTTLTASELTLLLQCSILTTTVRTASGLQICSAARSTLRLLTSCATSITAYSRTCRANI